MYQQTEYVSMKWVTLCILCSVSSTGSYHRALPPLTGQTVSGGRVRVTNRRQNQQREECSGSFKQNTMRFSYCLVECWAVSCHNLHTSLTEVPLTYFAHCNLTNVAPLNTQITLVSSYDSSNAVTVFLEFPLTSGSIARVVCGALSCKQGCSNTGKYCNAQFGSLIGGPLRSCNNNNNQ